MLTYKFNKGLIRTSRLLDALSIPPSTLDYWKWEWTHKKKRSTYEMGLRLIGNKAYWDPIVFVNWITQNKLTNRPTTPEEKLDQKKMVAFVLRNVETKKEHLRT
jgi:hypothetical protein